MRHMAAAAAEDEVRHYARLRYLLERHAAVIRATAFAYATPPLRHAGFQPRAVVVPPTDTIDYAASDIMLYRCRHYAEMMIRQPPLMPHTLIRYCRHCFTRYAAARFSLPPT